MRLQRQRHAPRQWHMPDFPLHFITTAVCFGCCQFHCLSSLTTHPLQSPAVCLLSLQMALASIRHMAHTLQTPACDHVNLTFLDAAHHRP